MSTTTTAPVAVAPFLDDPIRFAHELYSMLAAAGDPRLVDAAGVIEQDGGDTGDTATLAHEAGIRFGVAAEQLRRALVASGEG